MGTQKVRMIQLLLFLLVCGTWRTANLGADYCVLFYSNSLSHLKAFFHFSSSLWSNSLTNSLWMSHLIKRISCFDSPFSHRKVTAEVFVCFSILFYTTIPWNDWVVRGLGLLIAWLRLVWGYRFVASPLSITYGISWMREFRLSLLWLWVQDILIYYSVLCVQCL